jgi:hypothetical protein
MATVSKGLQHSCLSPINTPPERHLTTASRDGNSPHTQTMMVLTTTQMYSKQLNAQSQEQPATVPSARR